MSYNNIKKAALKLFSQKGFDGTTVKEIASEVGLKPSSIYSHISSKEELFNEIWMDCIQNVYKSVESIRSKVERKEEYDPERILYEYYIKIIKHFVKNKKEYLFLKQVTFFSKDKINLKKAKVKGFLDDNTNVEYFRKFFIKLQEKSIIVDSDYKDLFYYYIGVMIAYLDELLIHNIELNDKHIDKFWNVFWKGILK